jgi:aminobenzoyl-glutamate transport protein
MSQHQDPAPSEGPEPSSPEPSSPERRKAFARFLDFVEWLGNLLPHPVTLFAIFCVAVILGSGVASWLGLEVADPRPAGARGRSPDGMIEVVSLLNGAGLRQILEQLVDNFVEFVPLGTVLVAMLGVGVAEKSGLLGAAIRAVVLRAPRRLVTFVIVFAGVLSNTASEMGYVVLVPLAAVIYHSLGRHPLAGMAAAFAGVSGGYSANLFIGTVDPLLSGITEASAQLLDPAYTVNPAANYYFMAVSVLLVTGVAGWVSLSIVEPKLGPYDPSKAASDIGDSNAAAPLTRKERWGLIWAGVALLILLGIVLLLALPAGAPLRNPETGLLVGPGGSPLLSSVVAFIFVFFLVPGFVYGRVAGTLKNDRDVIDAMATAMSSMGLYIVLVFFAAQFVAFFRWTQLGSITAVLGAQVLRDVGLTGPEVFVFFILVCAFVNLMLGSASAQWAITAPIFVPMLMLIGYSPEVIQAAYRIGDSSTNIITPMMSYFGLILAAATRYQRDLGIGTLIAMMLPYSIFFMIGWTLLFYLWTFALGLPVGPGSPHEWLPG